MGHRIERIESIILRELTFVLRESRNPKFQFISITKVSVTSDLSYATVWYTIMGTTQEKEATSKELISARGYLRSELASRIDLRKTPELRFKYDESLEKGNRIEEILKQSKEN